MSKPRLVTATLTAALTVIFAFSSGPAAQLQSAVTVTKSASPKQLQFDVDVPAAGHRRPSAPGGARSNRSNLVAAS